MLEKIQPPPVGKTEIEQKQIEADAGDGRFGVAETSYPIDGMAFPDDVISYRLSEIGIVLDK